MGLPFFSSRTEQSNAQINESAESPNNRSGTDPILPSESQKNIPPPTLFNKPEILTQGNKSKSRKFVSKGEQACRETLEYIYEQSFPNVRPAWLVNPVTGERLELDCYNESLALAVEYNGIQHYKWPNFTGQSEEDFLNQVRRDLIKLKACRKRGIRLLIVPYTVPHKQIPSYLARLLPPTGSAI